MQKGAIPHGSKTIAAGLALVCAVTVTACEDSAPVSSGDGVSSAPVATTSNTTPATLNEEDAEKVAEIDIGADAQSKVSSYYNSCIYHAVLH